MKVLVTGGAGFIASHVVDRFLASGHEVVIVDNLASGFRENINPRARFYELDIRDEEGIETLFAREQPEVVNHHAAQMDVRKSTYIPMEDAAINILGTLNLILAGLRHGLKQFVYASSGGASYGEPQYMPVDEAHPINPICQYGISKHTVEHYLYLYQHNYGLNSVVLRYPNLYGPRQTPHGEAGVVAIFSGLLLAGKQPTIFGDGSKTRDYCYIDDVVAANLLVLGREGHAIFNLGTGLPTTDLAVFEAVRDAVGIDMEPNFAPPRLGEIQHIALSPAKAERELGWRAQVPFAEGVRRTVEYNRRLLREPAAI
jgi:UDP-glucose 4-epimerase